MRFNFKHFLPIAVWLIMGCTAQAQQLTVYATAVDRTGEPVQLQPAQLQVKDFSIKSAEPTKPAELGCVVVWDSSNSERKAYDSMTLAANIVLAKLLIRPHRCTFVDFDSVPRVASGSTNDPKDLIDTIAKLKPSGGTAAYDAVVAGCDAMAAEKLPAPRVMYVFSDFEDNESHQTREEMMQSLWKTNTRIYAFTPEGENYNAKGPRALENVAKETGGRIFTVPLRSKPEQMKKALERELEVISAELNAWLRIELDSSAKLKPNKAVEIKVSPSDKTIQLRVPSHAMTQEN